MSAIEELRAKQQAAGLVAPAQLDGDDSAVPVVQIATPAPTCPTLAGGGYIRIFPPKFQSIADLTPEWIEANWSAPGPWCSVEGHAQHEEFEANLAGVEK